MPEHVRYGTVTDGAGAIMTTTLRRSARFEGITLHGGMAVRAEVLPAAAGRGIVFRRRDVADADPEIPALWSRLVPARLCTRIANADGVGVSTIEHLMAAFAACGVRDAVVVLDGPEVPILDGSAAPFVRGLLAAGLMHRPGPGHVWRVLRPVEVREGDAFARLEPADGVEIDLMIDFPAVAIGRQRLRLALANGTAVREICDARTFTTTEDLARLRAAGLGRGGDLSNAVVYGPEGVLNHPAGLRRADEAVRHKALDVMGDLALAGAPILGRYVGERAGHALTARLLSALFTTEGAVERVATAGRLARRLPGAGLGPADLAEVA